MSDYFLSIGLGGMRDGSGRILATEPRFVQRHSADLWVSEDFQNLTRMNHASLIPREPDQSDYSDASADRHASQAVF